MPFLVLQYNRKIVKNFQLTPDRRMRIGRGEENDIRIDDSAVSTAHAEIELEGDYYFITDFNSRNGTFVNRELVISRRLNHGDRIAIGKHHLVFAYARSEQRPAEPSDPVEGATLCIDTPDHRAQLARSVAGIADREKKFEIRAYLTEVSGAGRSIPLEKPSITIGKSSGSDIVVRSWFVGETAARIIRGDNTFHLVPVEGKPPRVNSRVIEAETLLKEFDLIEIGSAAWQFHYGQVDGDRALK